MDWDAVEAECGYAAHLSSQENPLVPPVDPDCFEALMLDKKFTKNDQDRDLVVSNYRANFEKESGVLSLAHQPHMYAPTVLQGRGVQKRLRQMFSVAINA